MRYYQLEVMHGEGKARVGRKTKDLVKDLKRREIAVIDHDDLDAMGASGLVEAGVLAVINAGSSMTSRYPNVGPKILLDHHILLIDQVGPSIFQRVKSGDVLRLDGGDIYREDVWKRRPWGPSCSSSWVGSGVVLTEEMVQVSMDEAEDGLCHEIEKFVDNTMEYVEREKDLIIHGLQVPSVKAKIHGRHVVVVVRGAGYKEDLAAISSYIEEVNPVLIGVDGGADALLACGHTPDMIIGDMDSVSDLGLCCGAQLIVHAYQDGRAPGRERLERLNMAFTLFPAPGTSEDIAMLLAYEKGARLIVAVGTHSNLIDFLEKGRPGMASTFLVRMKIGQILVDARGVSQLYRGPSGTMPLQLMVAAMIPIVVLMALASPWRHWLQLLWLQIRLFVGGL